MQGESQSSKTRSAPRKKEKGNAKHTNASSNLLVMASNLLSMASNPIAMASMQKETWNGMGGWKDMKLLHSAVCHSDTAGNKDRKV